MKEKIVYSDEVSTIYQTSHPGEFQIIRRKQPRHQFDSDCDEVWVEVKPAKGMHFLAIETEAGRDEMVWPESAVNRGLLTYAEVCALPVALEEGCGRCGTGVDLRELHPQSPLIPSQGQVYQVIHAQCGTDGRAMILPS